MTTMTVSKLAARSGVSPSALRFYDSIGLLTPRRGANGYRQYDDEALHRLSFIATAKQLDLDLDTIGGLLAVWDSSPCATVKSELRPLVESRLDAAVRARAAVDELVVSLRQSLEHLDALPDREERCRPDCAVAEPAPVVCTLDASDRSDRMAEWHDVLHDAEVRDTGTGATAVLPLDRAADVAQLAAAEATCCPFLRFALELSDGRTRLTVTTTEAGRSTLDDLLGRAPDRSPA